MKSELHMTMDRLRDEMNQLLHDKIQDEEIRLLYDQYLQLEGVAEEELESFEQQYNVRLPEDFRAFYRHTNGSGYGLHVLYPGDAEQGRCLPFYLMSLEEMQETKRFFCDVDERLEEHYKAEEIRELDPEIKPYLFNTSWIPFAAMAGGSIYLLFDFDPTEEGTYGQIIMHVHDPDFVYYAAASFTELLQMSNRNLSLLDAIEY